MFLHEASLGLTALRILLHVTKELQQFVKGFARYIDARCVVYVSFLHEPDTLHGPNASLKGGVLLWSAAL